MDEITDLYIIVNVFILSYEFYSVPIIYKRNYDETVSVLYKVNGTNKKYRSY